MTHRSALSASLPPSLLGVLLALGAAATYGVLTPAAKGALSHVGPVRAAGLAYLAAGLVAIGAHVTRHLASASPTGRSVTARDVPRLLGMTVLGGILGPVLFFAGVSRIAAHDAAVLQHLEFALTILATILVLGERPGPKGIVGLVFVGAGVVLLSMLGFDASAPGGSSSGVALIAAACVAWAADNTLARGASDLDPVVVVSIKGLAAGAVLTLASAGRTWPPDLRAWSLVLLAGGIGVGVSLTLELLALRRIGAALNAGLFATGPAFGFVWSLVFLGERSTTAAWVALVLCAIGAVALALDSHGHPHTHPAVRHAHRHHHRDAHHDHDHGPGFDPSTEHVHEHEHEPLRHAHEHVHDAHHRHRH